MTKILRKLKKKYRASRAYQEKLEVLVAQAYQQAIRECEKAAEGGRSSVSYRVTFEGCEGGYRDARNVVMNRTMTRLHDKGFQVSRQGEFFRIEGWAW